MEYSVLFARVMVGTSLIMKDEQYDLLPKCFGAAMVRRGPGISKQKDTARDRNRAVVRTCAMASS